MPRPARPLLVLCVAFVLAASSCRKPESWTAIVYRGQTDFQFREAGVYPNVQECLLAGSKEKGEGFLECGLNCRWDGQGMWQCEKTVRLMEHQQTGQPTR